MQVRVKPAFLVWLCCIGAPAVAAGPVLHGHGGHTCVEYLDTWRRWEAGQDTGILDYFGYEQWFAGFVSGLSLATAEDVLRGAGVEGMMRRVRRNCEDDRKQDVFGAAIVVRRSRSRRVQPGVTSPPEIKG